MRDRVDLRQFRHFVVGLLVECQASLRKLAEELGTSATPWQAMVRPHANFAHAQLRYCVLAVLFQPDAGRTDGFELRLVRGTS